MPAKRRQRAGSATEHRGSPTLVISGALAVRPDLSTNLNMVLTSFLGSMASTASSGTQLTYYFDGNVYCSMPIWSVPAPGIVDRCSSWCGSRAGVEVNQFPYCLDWSLLLVERCKTGSSVDQMMKMCAPCSLDLRQLAENIVISSKRAEN